MLEVGDKMTDNRKSARARSWSKNKFGLILRAARNGFFQSNNFGTFVRFSDGDKEDTFKVEVCPPQQIFDQVRYSNPKGIHHYSLGGKWDIDNAILALSEPVRQKVRAADDYQMFIVDYDGGLVE